MSLELFVANNANPHDRKDVRTQYCATSQCAKLAAATSTYLN
jgi:hypothetical protein